MQSMTSRERVLAAIRRQPVDHVPFVPNFNALRAVQRKRVWNFPWPEDASNEDRIRYLLEELGTDTVVNTGASMVRPHPDVTEKAWVEGDVLHKTYTTPAGDLHASMDYNEMWPYGEDIPFYSDFNVGHVVEPWLETEADLECFKYVQRVDDDDDTLTRARQGLTNARALADRYGIMVQASCGTGLTGAQQLFGADRLCLMLMDNPDLVDAYLEHEHGISMRQLEVLGEGNVDAIRRNGFYETADFYGPQMLEQFLGKRLRAEVEAAHAAGMVASYTIHTGVMPILDYLAALPFDSLFGIDIAFKDVDLHQVRDKLAPTKSFYTGPSSTYHIWNGPEPTRQAVRHVFDVIGKTGLILAPCVSFHSIMPWESALATVDEWKRLR